MFASLLPRWLWLTIKDAYINIIKHPRKTKDGVWVYVGLYGEGKTLSMVKEAHDLWKKHAYKIYSNFGLPFQDGEITCWQDLLDVPPYSVICFDEISNLLNNYAFREMPDNLFSLLSQNRKLHIRIMGTVQVFDDTIKKFRTLTRYVIVCKKFGRLVQNKFYSQYQFGRGDTVKRSYKTKYYLAEDYLFDLYNTYEFIKKLAKDKVLKSPAEVVSARSATEPTLSVGK